MISAQLSCIATHHYTQPDHRREAYPQPQSRHIDLPSHRVVVPQRWRTNVPRTVLHTLALRSRRTASFTIILSYFVTSWHVLAVTLLHLSPPPIIIIIIIITYQHHLSPLTNLDRGTKRPLACDCYQLADCSLQSGTSESETGNWKQALGAGTASSSSSSINPTLNRIPHTPQAQAEASPPHGMHAASRQPESNTLLCARPLRSARRRWIRLCAKEAARAKGGVTHQESWRNV